jgi:glyoxylase-like metal-dependent hydrolase (beta-lactamase superfamily II)
MNNSTRGNPIAGVSTFVLPVAGPLRSVNVHLVELEEGYLLVDTGIQEPECLAELERALAKRGIAWSDIRALVLTHLHPDHVGNAETVLERSGARLFMHRLDAENMANLARLGRSPFFDEAWRLGGVPEPLREKLEQRVLRHRRSFPARQPDRPLEGGERIAIRGGVLEAVWTPGHSAGHVCLYWSERRCLIAGDHLLEEISPNVGWRPGQDTLAQYLDSLERTAGLDVEWVLPSHGDPFRDHGARVRALLEHHEERCREIFERLAQTPLTAHELVQTLWPKGLGLMQHNLALLEVLAHLEYLRRRGPVVAEALFNGAITWRVSV